MQSQKLDAGGSSANQLKRGHEQIVKSNDEGDEARRRSKLPKLEEGSGVEKMDTEIGANQGTGDVPMATAVELQTRSATQAHDSSSAVAGDVTARLNSEMQRKKVLAQAESPQNQNLSVSIDKHPEQSMEQAPSSTAEVVGKELTTLTLTAADRDNDATVTEPQAPLGEQAPAPDSDSLPSDEVMTAPEVEIQRQTLQKQMLEELTKTPEFLAAYSRIIRFAHYCQSGNQNLNQEQQANTATMVWKAVVGLIVKLDVNKVGELITLSSDIERLRAARVQIDDTELYRKEDAQIDLLKEVDVEAERLDYLIQPLSLPETVNDCVTWLSAGIGGDQKEITLAPYLTCNFGTKKILVMMYNIPQGQGSFRQPVQPPNAAQPVWIINTKLVVALGKDLDNLPPEYSFEFPLRVDNAAVSKVIVAIIHRENEGKVVGADVLFFSDHDPTA